jgi:protein-S-isoprenylcysteine O-methyltransferase Ste14
MTEPPIFRFLAAALLIAFVAHRAYYTRKFPPSEAATVDKLQPGLAARLASILSILALAASAAYVIDPSWIAWAALPLPLWSRWIGVVLALAGFALLEWSHRALGREWSEQPRLTQSQRLVQSGPYHWVRHPIYTSFLVILGSTLLITANWLVGLLWITSVAIDTAVRIRYEEALMSARFDDEYRVYAARTGRLFPRLWGRPGGT